MLVFADTPVDVAARGAAFAGFIGAGQTCIAGSRLMVQRSIYEPFVDALAEVARGIRIGDPADPATQLGPVISERARTRILGTWSRASPPAPALVTGGTRGRGPGLEGGFFVEPTVLADVTNDMARRPGGDLRPRGRGHPVRRRGRGRRDRQRLAVRARLGDLDPRRRARPPRRRPPRGRHGLGQRPPPPRPVLPWGGLKESGVGREGGWESFHDFTHVRAVTIRTAPDDVDWYGGQATGRLN